MLHWFKPKTKLERLKERYRILMKRSFNISPYNAKESERLINKAQKIKQKIQECEQKHGNNFAH